MSDAKPPSRQKQIEEFIFIRIPHVLSGTLFLIAVVLNIVNVIGRYVFGMPVFWAEEALDLHGDLDRVPGRGHDHLSRRASQHGPGIFQDAGRLQRIVRIAIAIALIVCTVYTAMQSWKVVELHYLTSGVTAGTNIPLVVPHAALLFGFSFMALAAIVRFRSYVTGKFD